MDVEIKNKKVYISMINHLKSAIETYEEGLGLLKNNKSATPGSSFLFHSSDEDTELNEKNRKSFTP